MRIRFQCALAVALGLSSSMAAALTPEQVFEKVAPSVWAVRALNASEAPIGFGSAVVIAPGRLVTACSALARARSLELRRGNLVHAARLALPDVDRNLCELQADGLDAPAVTLAPAGAAKVGQPAYLVSVPQRLATTLGAGFIAGLGSDQPRIPPIQSTVAVGQGSAGGGLFDAEARLVGIAMPAPTGADAAGAGLGFAAPAEWLAEIPARAAAALARRSETPAAQAGAGAGTLPAAGTTWRYEYVDRKFSMRIPFTLRVSGVEGWSVNETLQVEGAEAAQEASIEARRAEFVQRTLRAGRALFEFAPYLHAVSQGNAPLVESRPGKYPRGGSSTPWAVTGGPQGPEPVSVPAGSFNAQKYVITGSRPGPPGNFASRVDTVTRFVVSVWYAPEVRRYVRIHHQTWNVSGVLLGDESIELQEMRR